MSQNWNVRAAAVIGFLLAAGLGQLPPKTAMAQVIQLPSVRQFSMQGGAMVPDGGTAYLGGYGTSAQGSIGRGGLFPSRAIGGIGSHQSVSVSAQIIDLAAIDEAILGTRPTATPQNSTQPRLVSREAEEAELARQFISDYRTLTTPQDAIDYRDWTRTLSSSPASEPVDPSLVAANVRYYLKMAKEAENLNRIQSSRVYYRLAWETMTPEMRARYRQILADRALTNREAQTDESSDRRKF
jgi:hypothetical protein